jgi:hypothetical protein
MVPNHRCSGSGTRTQMLIEARKNRVSARVSTAQNISIENETDAQFKNLKAVVSTPAEMD